MTFAPTDRLAEVTLDEERPRARSPQIQQEIDVALFDLAEDNRFRLAEDGGAAGPYRLVLGLADRALAFDIAAAGGARAAAFALPLAPLRDLIEDYFAVCERYYAAVKRLPPSQIEAIDADRRALHDEGAEILRTRLAPHAVTDTGTARRLFTLLCALRSRG